MEDIEVREDPDGMTMEELMQYCEDNPEPSIGAMTDSEIQEMYQTVFRLLNEKIFNNELPPIKICYFSQEEAIECFGHDFEDTAAFFRPDYIALGLDTFPQYGITEEDVDNLFHELIHHYCYLHSIQDIVKGTQYHTETFRDTVKKFGGRCEYLNEIYGYVDSRLPDELISEIIAQI